MKKKARYQIYLKSHTGPIYVLLINKNAEEQSSSSSHPLVSQVPPTPPSTNQQDIDIHDQSPIRQSTGVDDPIHGSTSGVDQLQPSAYTGGDSIPPSSLGVEGLVNCSTTQAEPAGCGSSSGRPTPAASLSPYICTRRRLSALQHVGSTALQQGNVNRINCTQVYLQFLYQFLNDFIYLLGLFNTMKICDTILIKHKNKIKM